MIIIIIIPLKPRRKQKKRKCQQPSDAITIVTQHQIQSNTAETKKKRKHQTLSGDRLKDGSTKRKKLWGSYHKARPVPSPVHL